MAFHTSPLSDREPFPLSRDRKRRLSDDDEHAFASSEKRKLEAASPAEGKVAMVEEELHDIRREVQELRDDRRLGKRLERQEEENRCLEWKLRDQDSNIQCLKKKVSLLEEKVNENDRVIMKRLQKMEQQQALKVQSATKTQNNVQAEMDCLLQTLNVLHSHIKKDGVDSDSAHAVPDAFIMPGCELSQEVIDLLDLPISLLDSQHLIGFCNEQNFLGKGHFGTAYKVSTAGKVYCVKVFHGHVQWSTVLAEVKAMVKFRNTDGLLHLVGAGPVKPYTIVTSYGGSTSVYKWIEQMKQTNPTEEKLLEGLTIIKNMAHALQNLHDKGFAHNDIKGDNIVFNPTDSSVTLTHFGSARKFGCFPYARGTDPRTCWHLDPQLLLREETSAPATDMYSVGYQLSMFFPLLHKFRRVYQRQVEETEFFVLICNRKPASTRPSLTFLMNLIQHFMDVIHYKRRIRNN